VRSAAGATLRAKVDVATAARRGDHVGLAFDAAAVSLFDAASGRALRTARDDHEHAAHSRSRHG
jgi:multiple sugar transport system ATP-binding protein